MQYRYFLIDGLGQRLPREEFMAENDDDARRLAQKFMDGHAIEIWQEDRLVLALGKKPPKRK